VFQLVQRSPLYVLKEAAEQDLVEAVRLASRGQTSRRPRVGAKLAAAPPEVAGPPDGLTEREAEILRLIALGHTNSEIANSSS
jgi:two-component system, NarL family, response regulator NreC